MDYRSPLSKARGLGSAKSGTGHWWLQRVSAVALIPLSYWLVVFLGYCQHNTYQQTVAWLTTPVNTVAIFAWIILVFYHAALGVQVVFEDYVPKEGQKIILIWSANLVFLFLGLAAILAVFRILLAG
ncbi:MAG: succinate dehydrogenase, hydrophobic membrane anchor protein [Methylococcaceae bacterium]|jgi:succinate dehydrogenase / fumarate reductase membrane anchor subunit